MPRNLVGALRRLGTGAYTVTRTGAGDYGDALPLSLPYAAGDGIARLPAPTTFSIQASIQPVSGRDLLRLPEGLRTQQLVCIYTDTALQTALAPSGNQADVVAYKGQDFECQTILDWSDSGDFFKVIAQKIGQ